MHFRKRNMTLTRKPGPAIFQQLRRYRSISAMSTLIPEYSSVQRVSV